VNLWLDDIRPAPVGWQWAKTVEEAQAMLLSGKVENASLDHDLGACATCLNGRTPEQWLAEHNFEQMPQCEHFGTGYTLVCWMEETGNWPNRKPVVHSRNPAGKAKMEQAINHSWKSPQSGKEGL